MKFAATALFFSALASASPVNSDESVYTSRVSVTKTFYTTVWSDCTETITSLVTSSAGPQFANSTRVHETTSSNFAESSAISGKQSSSTSSLIYKEAASGSPSGISSGVLSESFSATVLSAKDSISGLTSTSLASLASTTSDSSSSPFSSIVESTVTSSSSSAVTSPVASSSSSAASSLAASSLAASSSAISSSTASSTATSTTPTTSSATSSSLAKDATASSSTTSSSATATSTPSTLAVSKSSTSSTSSTSASAATSSSVVHSGDGTWFYTGLGACGWVNTDSDYIAAIGHGLFDQYTPGTNPNENTLCGKKILVKYGDKSIVVTAADRCEGCKPYDLDFTPGAFSQLADQSVGRIKITWEWI